MHHSYLLIAYFLVISPSLQLTLFWFITLLLFGSRFESKELKMIRVAVSSFYDYLALVVKTMQEFDTSTDVGKST